eukprot:COSAG06_NODE_36806_length_442_cov_1.612245_1_plen_58_part_10
MSSRSEYARQNPHDDHAMLCCRSDSESSHVAKSRVVSANIAKNTTYAWNLSMKIARQL